MRMLERKLIADFPRVLVIKTGLTPSASGSAYLELESSSMPVRRESSSLSYTPSALKLSCAVHGPRPLPRSAPFTPHLLLSTHVKFAPFATRLRRGHIRDSSERDLSVHLESALRGVIISERWPKSGLEIIITVLEGEQDHTQGQEVDTGSEGASPTGGWSMMSILSGCITVASAAIVDAGVDCVDFVTGGVAAVVRQLPSKPSENRKNYLTIQRSSPESMEVVIDPCPSEHPEIGAACVVAYLQSRDEITEMWAKGDAMNLTISKTPGETGLNVLMDHAVDAAIAARLVLIEAISESTELKLQGSK